MTSMATKNYWEEFNISTKFNHVMVWHQNSPPSFAWDMDLWIRDHYGNKFLAVHSRECWVAKDQIIPYADSTFKMGRNFV